MSEIVLIAILGVVVICMLSLLWWVASPALGKAYAWLRIVETAGTWLFSDWGRYFWRMPFGEKFTFTSIFRSSLPFNIAFAVLVSVIGLMAHHKVSERHIRAKVKHREPIGYRELMQLQSKDWPANQFFLDFNLGGDYSISKGPGRMPLTALELLLEANAIEGIYEGDTVQDPNAQTGWKINEEILTERLVRDFGPHNPFAVKNFPLRNKDKIKAAIDDMPWHVVSVVYAAVARLYALDTMATDDFEATNVAIEDYFKDIWRHINKGKAELGDRLVLGYMDEHDRQLKLETAIAKYPKIKDLKVLTLRDYLDEVVTVAGIEVPRAEAFQTTIQARSELLRILTEYGEVDEERLVSIKDERGRKKKFKDLSKLEIARFAQIRKKQEQCVTTKLQRLLTANGYQFGLAGTLLKDARAGGTLPPSLFRWMRFYDYSLWSYLRIVGMNTPTPEVAGMFDHAQTEEKSQLAMSRPYLVSSVEGVRAEASKYITDDMRKRYAIIQTERAARQKTHTAAASTLQEIATNLAKAAKEKQAKTLDAAFNSDDTAHADREV